MLKSCVKAIRGRGRTTFSSVSGGEERSIHIMYFVGADDETAGPTAAGGAKEEDCGQGTGVPGIR